MRSLLSNFILLHNSSDIKVIKVPSGEGDKFVLTALPLEAQVSPVYVIVAEGEVRDSQVIKSGLVKRIIVARNNDKVLMFQKRK